MQSMKAAVFEREGVLTLKEVPIPTIQREDQVLLRVEAVSICGTDVHITALPAGYVATPNTILGHELVGVVEKTGSEVTHLAVGDRVVLNPNDYCGTCVYCQKGLPNQCENIKAIGIDYDGGFASHCVVSGKLLYKISPKVPAALAACAEPLACAVNGFRKVNIQPGESAVIIGGGPIGLMIALLAKASGVGKLYLLETAPYRAEFAKSLQLGCVLNPKTDSPAATILKETGIGADYVFDVTGSQAIPAIELVRKGGKVVLFGVNKSASDTLCQHLITTKEIALLGTWLANATFPDAVRILEEGIIDLAPLVTHQLPLERLEEGLALLKKGEGIKIVINMVTEQAEEA